MSYRRSKADISISKLIILFLEAMCLIVLHALDDFVVGSMAVFLALGHSDIL